MVRGLILAAFAVVVLLPLVTVALVSGGLSRSSKPEDKPVSADRGVARDARMYETDVGVSRKEALRRLKLQNGSFGDSVSRLEARLNRNERGTFAGLYIQNKPNYRVVVRLTRGGRENVQRYIDNPYLARLVEVKPAGATLVELNAAQVEADRIVRARGIPAESFVDIMDNDVKLRVVKQKRLETTLRKAGVRLPAPVKVVKVKELLMPAVQERVSGPQGAKNRQAKPDLSK